ncbi:MAG: TldD/PmbA family protein [Planctomycetota bacterium]|nr:TldD/PmbA family protein [Planctomycetota bacterium]
MSTHTQAERARFDGRVAEQREGRHAQALLNEALEAGAGEAEVVAQGSETIAVRFEGEELKLSSADSGSALGLRVFDDKRMGFSSTNQVGPDARQRAAMGALGLARCSPQDAANVLPVHVAVTREVDACDDQLSALGVADIVALARDLVARTLAIDPRLRLDSSEVSLRRGAGAVHSSAGVAASASSTSLSLSLFGMAVDAEDVGGFDYWGGHALNLEAFEGLATESITRFSDAALGNLGAQSSESYTGPVLFSPSAFMDVFVQPLVAAASAIAVQRGRSSLKGKLGQTIATSEFNLLDDPTDRRLMGLGAFDREGTPTQPFKIIQDGVLQAYLYNGYAAAVDGVLSTGHAAGGARSVPGLGAHGLSVAPGDGGSAKDMLGHLDRGLLVGRFSGSVDPASGDFSGVAKSGRWVEAGEIVRPVRETLFGGNLFDLLPQILRLSSEAEGVMGAAFSPWAMVDGVAVTAG